MKNILIVDDNTSILDGLATTFGILLRGYTILTAENGMKAVKIMESVPVDLILTDLSMPVMDGYGLIQHTKKNYPRTAVFVMTGVYTADVAERLRPFGIVRCVEKPFDYEELAHEISHELEGRFAVSVPLTGAAGRHIVAR
jgi:two-component system response regulator YesN